MNPLRSCSSRQTQKTPNGTCLSEVAVKPQGPARGRSGLSAQDGASPRGKQRNLMEQVVARENMLAALKRVSAGSKRALGARRSRGERPCASALRALMGGRNRAHRQARCALSLKPCYREVPQHRRPCLFRCGGRSGRQQRRCPPGNPAGHSGPDRRRIRADV